MMCYDQGLIALKQDVHLLEAQMDQSFLSRNIFLSNQEIHPWTPESTGHSGLSCPPSSSWGQVEKISKTVALWGRICWLHSPCVPHLLWGWKGPSNHSFFNKVSRQFGFVLCTVIISTIRFLWTWPDFAIWVVKAGCDCINDLVIKYAIWYSF